MAESVLAIDNLSVVFPNRRGDLHALSDVSLQIQQGEILGFVGESGAGKSMTGAAIMGLIEPPGKIASGRIALHGRTISDDPAAARGKDIGMIFQDPLTSLNPLMRVGDQLVETITCHLRVSVDEARRRAARGLEEVGIDPERLNAFPHEFSGGMRQRVVIALALAAEPALVIADEPTTALDVSIQAQILKILRRICQERKAAVILITHDMGVIAETADRVAVFYAGRLIETGPTHQIISQPRHPYTQGLIAATPKLDEGSVETELLHIRGAMPGLNALPSGCAFHPRCAHKSPRCAMEIPRMKASTVACFLYEDQAQ